MAISTLRIALESEPEIHLFPERPFDRYSHATDSQGDWIPELKENKITTITERYNFHLKQPYLKGTI